MLSEHLISESVIRVLMADGEFSVSGLPWLDQGVEKLLPVEAFRTNCLCAKHNRGTQKHYAGDSNAHNYLNGEPANRLLFLSY